MPYHDEVSVRRVRTGWYSQRESAGGEEYPYTWCERCNNAGRKYGEPQVCNRYCVWRGPKPEGTKIDHRQDQLDDIISVLDNILGSRDW